MAQGCLLIFVVLLLFCIVIGAVMWEITKIVLAITLAFGLLHWLLHWL